MSAFKAFLITQNPDNKQISGDFVDFQLQQLDPGEILIRVYYSSVNYKDALAATGKGKIIRRFPCIGGIDLAGEVVESSDARFKAGMSVIATSFDIGVAHHGGYAKYARIPADWVIPLPENLSLFEAMALGTAGFTAALGITRMEDNSLTPSNGPVIVTGATGGVGGLAINMLAQLGYHVVALTGKEAAADYLKSLGANEINLRSSIDIEHTRSLEMTRWAGAIDNLGGSTLHWLLATMKQGGSVASIGNAESVNLTTTVFPFILRGVNLLGIDSGYTGQPVRGRVWDRLSTDLKPDHLDKMIQTIEFNELPAAFERLVEGKNKGRIVVRIGD